MKAIELHCDGFSVNGKGKSGAGAILLYNGIKREWQIPLGTENTFRAELLAVIHGLRKLSEPCKVDIFSDNQIAMYCITGEYRKKSNLELWDLYAEAAKGHEITAHWNALGSTQWNRRANELSQQAALTQVHWQSF